MASKRNFLWQLWCWWWFRNPGQPPVGCIKPCSLTVDSPYQLVISPDFWTINRTYLPIPQFVGSPCFLDHPFADLIEGDVPSMQSTATWWQLWTISEKGSDQIKTLIHTLICWLQKSWQKQMLRLVYILCTDLSFRNLEEDKNKS